MSERICQVCLQNTDKWATKTICKKCYNQRWHKNHPNRRGPQRYHKPELRFKHGMRSAQTRNIVWNLSFAEFKILIKQTCYYCQNNLGKHIHSGSGLDRIDNTKGYTIDNVLPCCGICNKTRNNFFTVEETKVAIKAILEYRKLKGQTDKPGSVSIA